MYLFLATIQEIIGKAVSKSQHYQNVASSFIVFYFRMLKGHVVTSSVCKRGLGMGERMGSKIYLKIKGQFHKKDWALVDLL